MSPSFSSVHKALHHFYTETGSLAAYGRNLEYFSRRFLERAEIHKNLSRAESLLALFDKLKASGLLELDDIFTLSCEVEKNYRVIELLPKNLKKRQKKAPIHKQAIKTEIRKGIDVKFSDKTLGLSHILKPKYKVYPRMNNSEFSGLKKSQDRRNLIHFTMAHAWSTDINLISFVKYLDEHVRKS